MEVLYRDEWLLAVNKPSGLITHRGWANDRDNALVRARALAGSYVYPVHRLDRATSGVLVFALSQEGASRLGEQLDAGGFAKRYLALVRGVIAATLEIDHPLRVLREETPKSDARQPAHTTVTRLGTFERYSLVEAVPHTGRSHQLRRHLKHVSHPIIGDTRYGAGEHNRAFRARFGLHRLALHASSLTLVHPDRDERITLRAPLPADFAQPLEAMSLLALANAAIQPASVR